MHLERSRDIDIQTDLTIEELLERAGNVGRFQYFAFIALYLVICPNGFLIYNIPYLILEPQFQCFQATTQTWAECGKELACQASKNGLTRYRIDDDISLTNFVTNTAGLECAEEGNIMMIGTYFFFGVFLSFILWIKCTDMWSRKPIILLGSAIQLLGYSGLIFLSSGLSAIQTYYFFLGLGTVLSMCTSYNFLIELTPRNSKIVVGTVFLSLQIVPATVLPVYLSIVQQNVFPFLTLGLGLSTAGFIFVLLALPESPQYLFATEKFLEC